MAIEYRSVDADEVKAQVETARALEAEAAAFSSEVDVLRLEAAEKKAAKADKEEAKAATQAARDAAKRERNRAHRLSKNGVLDSDTITETRRSLLNAQIAGLENEHITHKTLLEQREAALSATTADKPLAAEKEEIEARAEENRRALATIEAAHAIAVAELEKLPAPPEPEVVEEPEPVVTDTRTPDFPLPPAEDTEE